MLARGSHHNHAQMSKPCYMVDRALRRGREGGEAVALQPCWQHGGKESAGLPLSAPLHPKSLDQSGISQNCKPLGPTHDGVRAHVNANKFPFLDLAIVVFNQSTHRASVSFNW